MTHLSWLTLGVLALGLLANCSSETSTGGCDPDSRRTCLGADDCVGEQRCSTDHLWGECLCNGPEPGTGGQATGGASTGGGAGIGGTADGGRLSGGAGWGGGTPTGGALGSGGSSGAGTGATLGSGGVPAGGASGSGGATADGASGSGGTAAGGASGSGPETGGGGAAGGASGSGGAAIGGASGGSPADGGADSGGMGGDASSGASGFGGTAELAPENTSADCVVPELPGASQLPQIAEFPDPFTKIDGGAITKKSEWHCRRQEIRKQAEKYIYGEKPTPDVVTGTVTQNRVSVHVEDEGKEIDFGAEIVLPSMGQGPFPAIINVGAKGGFGGISLGESRILQQGVAVIYYNHNEVGTEGTPEASRGQPNPGLFYDIYGGNHSAGLLMAWAWGASRIIDVLQASGADIIDPTGLGVTGCSRNGKGAFAIGVFDDRIALTIPQETSTAGVPAYRIVDILGQERTDHNHYGLNWLCNNFEPFVYNGGTSNAVKLPIDSHSLVAMIAPRGLLVLENPHQAQMGAPAGHAATVAGAEVYKALGVEGNVNYHSNVSDTAHCSNKNEYTDLLVESIAVFLKHEGDGPGTIEVGANGSLNVSEWITWDTPSLADDLVADGAD